MATTDPRPCSWKELESQEDRKRAHLAAIARNDCVFGGAKALVIARKCSKWDAQAIVNAVYAESGGATGQRWRSRLEAHECRECGQAWVNLDAALNCCEEAPDDEDGPYLDDEYEEELGVSDDNWACGTLEVDT